MSPRPQKGPRLYTREQGGQLRYYADLRSRGRGRVALIPEGETQATTDPEIAAKLLADLLKDIREEGRDRAILGVKRRATLGRYVSEHLVKKAKSGRVTEGHLGSSQHHLTAAISFFGAERELASIGVEHVQLYAEHLAGLSNGRDGVLSPATQRKYLNALSNLFRRAQGEGVIRGANPVAAMMDKPVPDPVEAPWLEVWEGALLLEAARTYPFEGPVTTTAGERLHAATRERIGDGPEAVDELAARLQAEGLRASPESIESYFEDRRIPTLTFLRRAERVLGLEEGELHRGRGWNMPKRPLPIIYPVLATFLLSGGRKAEVMGLELRDVSLRHGVIHFRPSDRRRLKTRTSVRSVPLWPQLRAILEPHIALRREEGARDDSLLFPSPLTGGLLVDIRKSLDAIAVRAGWRAGEIRTKAFRHAYCAARLQTLDRGHPVSIYTVARELGHGGESMVKRVYGHLGQVRHRSEVVEFLIEQQREDIPPERIRSLLRAV